MHGEMCGNCGARLQGPFCHQCGEQAPHKGDLALRHLTHEFQHELSHVDGKIWRTLRALMFAPGRLTAEYWAGHRGRWVRPIRLYLVISALQLLLVPNSSGPLGIRVWLSHSPNGEENYTIGSKPLNQRDPTPVEEEMNHRIQKVYLWVRYVSLALFAVASLGLFHKAQPFYGAHLIFGLHYYSFDYLASALASLLPTEYGPSLMILVGWLYLVIALRAVYGLRFWKALLKGLVLFVAVAITESLMVVAALEAALHWPH
jgi:hypothetical protein